MISICIPMIRPEHEARLREAIALNAGIPPEDYEIVIQHDNMREGCARTLHKAVQRAQGDKICFIGDDTMPEKDFLKFALEIMEYLPDGWGVVGLNSQESKHAAHFLADRRMSKILPDGYFFHPEYYHCWCDHELTDIAGENNRYAF